MSYLLLKPARLVLWLFLLSSCMPLLFARLSQEAESKVWYDGEVVPGFQLGYCFAVSAVRGHECHEGCSPACERGAHIEWRSHHPSLGPWPAHWTVTDQWRQELALETGREVR